MTGKKNYEVSEVRPIKSGGCNIGRSENNVEVSEVRPIKSGGCNIGRSENNVVTINLNDDLKAKENAAKCYHFCHRSAV